MTTAREAEDQDMRDMLEAIRGLKAPKPEQLRDCGDGEVLPILAYPDPRLREECTDVDEFGEPLRKLVADLAMTMYAAKGVGLAAPQVGIPKRVFVLDMLNAAPPQEGKPPSQLLVAVNPKVWLMDEPRRDAERCLSFPDANEVVPRAARVALMAYRHTGEPYAMSARTTLGRIIQHEYDHLEGKLFIDRISKKKARALKQRVQRAARGRWAR